MPLAPFDILKKQNDGSFIWVEALPDLHHAEARIEDLSAASPGEYLVFDQNTQRIVAVRVAAERAQS
jgi:hypothetical protein